MEIMLCGKPHQAESEKTAYDILKEAGLMTREVIAAEIDGAPVALTETLTEGASLSPLTFADEAGKRVFWHTASHIMAQAVKRLYPAVKLTIGPAVEEGFYYDFDSDTPFTQEALEKIEGEMKKEIGRAHV